MIDTRNQYINFTADGIAEVDFEVEQTEFEVDLTVSGGVCIPPQWFRSLTLFG